MHQFFALVGVTDLVDTSRDIFRDGPIDIVGGKGSGCDELRVKFNLIKFEKAQVVTNAGIFVKVVISIDSRLEKLFVGRIEGSINGQGIIEDRRHDAGRCQRR